MKRVNETVGRNFPAGSGAGTGLEGFLVEGDEALEERAEDVVIDGAAGDVRIEVLDLGAVADMENALTVAGLDQRLATRTCGRGGDDGGKNGEESVREPGHVELDVKQEAHRKRVRGVRVELRGELSLAGSGVQTHVLGA
jgi:hypothetical protein